MSLKKYLKSHNISMYRLSKISGVPKTVIIDICSGKSLLENCTTKTAFLIANALDCTVEELSAICSCDFIKSLDKSSSSILNSTYYITGIHALNIPCSLETSGDWHASALSWKTPFVKNSRKSIWGNYGIELSDNIPENPGKHFVANHIRACLDLLEEGRFSAVGSMRNDFIGNDEYNEEIFRQVLKLKNHVNWNKIREFMKKEYRSAWLDFERSLTNA